MLLAVPFQEVMQCEPEPTPNRFSVPISKPEFGRFLIPPAPQAGVKIGG
jgi:hypothetical protein